MENIHLKTINAVDLGEITLLVGDPARVALIAEILLNPRQLISTREFILVSGHWKGKVVSVCSTGVGIGSTEIALIELIQSGAKKFVRVGGCGGLVDFIEPGDLILNHAMVRDPGTLSAYALDSYPAVADPSLLSLIKHGACHQGFQTHIGLGMTTQSYYLGQGRRHNISNGPQVDVGWMKYWQDRHIINYEMETAVIFLISSLYQIPAANCLVVHVSRLNEKWVAVDEYMKRHVQVAKMVLDSCITN